MKNNITGEKIILGGAQFGMPYGILNKYDYVNEKIKYQILNFAYNNGINSIDLAQSYGKSEELVGSYIKKNNNQKWRQALTQDQLDEFFQIVKEKQYLDLLRDDI